MGSVFKKTYTKPVPAGAEMLIRKGERIARWKDSKSRIRTARLTTGKDGAERLLIESRVYIAKYKDGTGIVQEVATGCRDEQAARRVLADLERRAELVKAKVLTVAEDRIADHQATPLAEHFDAFIDYLALKGTTAQYRKIARKRLAKVAAGCLFTSLAELRREPFERWIKARTDEGMAAQTRNDYQTILSTFGNWCVASHRLVSNPFAKMPKANVKADRRHLRRALEESELISLLKVAAERPLRDAMMIRRGKLKGQAVARLRPEVRDSLGWLGRERALIYKTLVLTGLRKQELASLTVAQLSLDGRDAYALLDAAAEKNREGNAIPLRSDLAADL